MLISGPRIRAWTRSVREEVREGRKWLKNFSLSKDLRVFGTAHEDGLEKGRFFMLDWIKLNECGGSGGSTNEYMHIPLSGGFLHLQGENE